MSNGVRLADDTEPMSDDVERLTRALADDLDSGFVGLFEQYRGLVFSVALRVSGRHADAEDLTAEAFLQAYRALSGYDRERIARLKLRAWLLTIVMNLRRNRWRSEARKPPPGPLDPVGSDTGDRGAVDHEDPREGVEAAVLRHETGSDLAELLGLLTEEQRAAVVLRHIVDLPIGEIAAVLGVPQGTVKSHISRGLHRLRSLTASEEVPDVEL